MIDGSENLMQIAQVGKQLVAVFEQYGMESYFKPDNLAKTGRFTRLNTLLKSKKIDAEAFIDLLNQASAKSDVQELPSMEDQGSLHFAAMLPCGLRNPFREHAEAHFSNDTKAFDDLSYIIEGNLNHELSLYPMLDSIESINELPDIIMASDVNNFFHRPFVERFIKKDVFTIFEPHPPNAYLEKASYSDPGRHYTMYTSNLLVMAVDKIKLAGRPKPEKWDDLLDPSFEDSIIMRGEDNFFCNAVMLPFYKDHGMKVIPQLARNIKGGMHPAEMVKLAGKKDEKGAAIYIMPYFFAKRITNEQVEIVWPSDGAIVSPVFLLIKKDKQEEHAPLLKYLFSRKTAELLKERHFTTTHPEVNHDGFGQEVKWLGWDFLNNHDMGKLKTDIRNEFMNVWEAPCT